MSKETFKSIKNILKRYGIGNVKELNVNTAQKN